MNFNLALLGVIMRTNIRLTMPLMQSENSKKMFTV